MLSSCSFVVSKVAKIQDINPTTGNYAIGTQRFLLIDSSRTNWFLEGYEEPRLLMTQVWYPADTALLKQKSKYIDNKNALTETIKLQGYKVPKILSNQIGYVDCNSWENATPIQNKKFPVIIFSRL